MNESIFEGEGITQVSPTETEAASAAGAAETEGAGVSDAVANTEASTDSASVSEGEDTATKYATNEVEGGESGEPAVDYEAIMREDLATLKATFPELAGLGDLSELAGALRYAALRDMGLSAVEAYMASSAPRTRRDNRSHLSSAVTRGASAPVGAMTHGELTAARELFAGMTDAEIHSLYKRVSG